MSKNKKETPDFIPGGEPPVARVKELDRLRLAEVWNEAVATKNAIAALQTMALKYDAEKRVLVLQIDQQNNRIKELQGELDKLLSSLRHNYNLPGQAQIDTKTGVVILPNQTPANQLTGAPIVQVQTAASDQEIDTANAVTSPPVISSKQQ